MASALLVVELSPGHDGLPAKGTPTRLPGTPRTSLNGLLRFSVSVEDVIAVTPASKAVSAYRAGVIADRVGNMIA
jgi:hypothetical protein